MNLFVGTVASLMLFAPALHAQEMGKLTVKDVLKAYDRDGDGKVSQKEFRVPYDLFQTLDPDKDGFVTKAELGKKGALALLQAATTMDAGKLVTLEERTGLVDIVAFDENFDGRISNKEFDRFLFALSDQDGDGLINLYEAKYVGRYGTFAAEYKGDGLLVMQRFDKNKDGVIEEKELKPGKKEFKVHDADDDGVLGPDELEKRPANGLQAYANFEADALIEKFDKNGDGKLGFSEIPGGKGSPLGQVDRDNSGEVDREELDRILKYQQSRQFSTIDPSFIERFDLNGDQKVARDEFPGPDSVFDRLDRNLDGAVTKGDG